MLAANARFFQLTRLQHLQAVLLIYSKDDRYPAGQFDLRSRSVYIHNPVNL
jgi:hypothetical protein